MNVPTQSAKCFQIQLQDNVATLLSNADPGAIEIVGARTGDVVATEPIPSGHKVALRDFAPKDPVIKYGVPIGHAICSISRGSWVHLHNLTSDIDVRSGTLDLHSGAPTDTTYE